MTLYGEERKRKRARARGLIAIELLQGLEKLLVLQRHFAALCHLSSSSPCLSVIRKKSTILCYLLQQMLLFVGSGGTYDTSKEDEVKKACHSHLGQSVLDCQPPTSSNIENWQGRDNTCRWCHNAQNMTSFVQKNMRKRCCWNCNVCTWLVYFPPITLLLILQWHTKVSEETFNVKS